MAKGKTAIYVRGGDKYNKLTIIEEVEPEIQYCHGKPTKLRKVKCKCECGGIVISRLIMVMNGDTKSCGCLKKEQDYDNLHLWKKPKYRELVNGLGQHVLYVRWSQMMGRCYNPTNHAYKHYGGRGILVDVRWHNISNFIGDMYPSYKDGLQLERVNNDKGYGVDNCTWATREEQANNRRTTVRVVYNGQLYGLSVICKKLNLGYSRIYTLMKYYKISFEESILKYDKIGNKHTTSSS